MPRLVARFMILLLAGALLGAVPVHATGSTNEPAAQPAGGATGSATFLEPFSRDPYFTDDTAVERVIAGPHGFAALGRRFHPSQDWVGDMTLWISADGSAWERVDMPMLDGGRPVVVESTPSGWLMLGNAGQVATSTDGRVWIVEPDPFPDRQAWDYIYAATQLGDGSLVAFGRRRGKLGVWGSSEGTQWRTTGRPTSSDPRRVLDAAPLGAGWLATAGHWVMPSADGRRWRTSAAPAKLVAVAAVGEQILGITGGRGPRVAWISTDGVEWAQGAVPPLDGRTPRLKGLASSRDRFVLVGSVRGEVQPGCWGDVASDVYGVWTSTDGHTWAPLDIDLPEHFRFADVAATDDVVVLVGQAQAEDGFWRPVVVRSPRVLAAAQSPPGDPPGYWVPPPVPASSPLGREVPFESGLTRLLDGRVLVAGGPRKQARLAIIIDPETGRREKVGPLPEPAVAPVLTTAPDGMVYLLSDDGPIQRFDPSTNRWRVLRAHTPRAKGQYEPPPTVSSAAWMPDGRLLVAIWPPMDRTGQPRFPAFDPERDRLKQVAAMPSGDRYGNYVVTTAAGETLAFTRSRAWRRAHDGTWVAGAPNDHLAEPSSAASPVALQDGRVAVLVPEVARLEVEPGGIDPCADYDDIFTLLDIYDPQADSWSTVGAFPPPHGQLGGAVQIDDGRLLINARGAEAMLAEIPSEGP